MGITQKREVSRILQTYGDMLYRTAWLLLGNPHDVQDALQETLLRYGYSQTAVRIFCVSEKDILIWIWNRLRNSSPRRKADGLRRSCTTCRPNGKPY